ncbi:IMPACT family protein [Georgenia sp. Z1491]|uniref:IMPACT family protein n=1 Tax=Georgenia sp. Z1491 TaxID=3416707 RepID=UPI003CF79288
MTGSPAGDPAGAPGAGPGTPRPDDDAPPAALRPARGARAESELVEKRSRFLAYAARADTAEDARALLAATRAEHPQARHHCSAWILPVDGGGPPVAHSSDDGEPSGTAGRPMLDRLSGAGLEAVAVVVVRYFGGTLLGTGGLVRAYGDAVGGVLAGLPLVRVRVLTRCTVAADHATGARIEAELRSSTASLISVLDVRWGPDGVELDVTTDDPAGLDARTAELSAGAARTTEIGPHEVELTLDE